MLDEGPLNVEAELTRSKFEKLTEHLVEKTRQPIEDALKKLS